MRRLLVFLFLIFTIAGTLTAPSVVDRETVLPEAKPVVETEQARKKRSTLYERSLKFGFLDGKLVRKYYFPSMTPEDINLALRDIRKFIGKIIRSTIKDKDRQVDENFLINILNIHGHAVRFIEDARVDLKTKRVFVNKESTTPGTISLKEYWRRMAETTGVELHEAKFYARCTDFLVVLLRECFSSTCTEAAFVRDVKSRWWYWAKKRLLTKLENDPVFGCYYVNRLGLFEALFSKWQDRIDQESAKERGMRHETNAARAA